MQSNVVYNFTTRAAPLAVNQSFFPQKSFLVNTERFALLSFDEFSFRFFTKKQTQFFFYIFFHFISSVSLFHLLHNLWIFFSSFLHYWNFSSCMLRVGFFLLFFSMSFVVVLVLLPSACECVGVSCSVCLFLFCFVLPVACLCIQKCNDKNRFCFFFLPFCLFLSTPILYAVCVCLSVCIFHCCFAPSFCFEFFPSKSLPAKLADRNDFAPFTRIRSLSLALALSLQ